MPARVNRQTVALVREEWRVVDRWWTEEPVNRRYFEVVLESDRATLRSDAEQGVPPSVLTEIVSAART